VREVERRIMMTIRGGATKEDGDKWQYHNLVGCGWMEEGAYNGSAAARAPSDDGSSLRRERLRAEQRRSKKESTIAGGGGCGSILHSHRGREDVID
jgi:hypothetical protein